MWHERENNGNLKNNPIFLGVLIVLISITLFLTIVIAIILVKMKCLRQFVSTVHPLITNGAYDEPSSYHFSHDKTVETNATPLPSHDSDQPQHENRQQDSDKSTESQMTSKILSSTSQIAENKVPKMVPNQTLFNELHGPHLAELSPNIAGNKTFESEGDTIYSSDPSSLKSSPLTLPIASANQWTSNALAVSSHYDGAENEAGKKQSMTSALPTHKVVSKRSTISNVERGTTSVASMGRHAYSYPVSRKRENAHRSRNSQRRRSKNILMDQHANRNDKDCDRRSHKAKSQKRRIRIPSGVLIMTSSLEDDAIYQSECDSNDSIPNVEPIIDAFHESPAVSYHETLCKERHHLRAPKENDILSLLPENLQSESGNSEVLALIKPHHCLNSDPRQSSTTEEIKINKYKTLYPQALVRPASKKADFKSHSQVRSTSLSMAPEDDMKVDSFRPVSEADAIIRQKKKRRRISSQQPTENVAPPGSHSQGDDPNRQNQKQTSYPSRQAITGRLSQDDKDKREHGELGQMYAGVQDRSLFDD